MVARAALDATGLVRPGSQIKYHYRVLVPADESPKAWMAALEKHFPEAGWRVRGLDDAAPGIRRFVERMTLFLTFVGLTALLVGGLGVGNGVSAYLDGKITTIATMKSVGASSDLVFYIYVVQVAILAVFGVAIGLLLGATLPMAVLGVVGEWLPVRPRIGLFPEPMVLGGAFGLLGTFTFALWPLARAREVPAANLFRHGIVSISQRPRPRFVALTVTGVAALAVLTVATASDRGFALWFVGGTLATLGGLRLGAAALTTLARRWSTGAAIWRLAMANLHRPGARTPTVVLSLGTGLAVLVGVALVEGNMRRQIAERIPEKAPAFFFIDIQPGQTKAFDAAVRGVPGTGDYRRMPTLRGRIVKIDGTPVDNAEIAPGVSWAVRGDRALTYSAAVPEEARIVAGRWWPADYNGKPLISFDAGVARGFGVGIGDSLTLNILGRDIEAEIANLREIDWRSLRFDFAIIFAPGTLEAAPHTHLAAVQARSDAEDAVERAATDAFPNVSAIRVRDALGAAARILDGIGWAVRGTSVLTLVAGALVLGGALAAGRRQRIYDSVVFKVLGATRAQILGVFLLEYGILGLATGLAAAAVGTLIAWAIVRHLMHMDWAFLPQVAAITVVSCLFATLAAGFAGTWLALGKKALPYLRNE